MEESVRIVAAGKSDIVLSHLRQDFSFCILHLLPVDIPVPIDDTDECAADSHQSVVVNNDVGLVC